MALRQFGKYVLVKPVEVATETPSGLSLPAHGGKYQQGKGIVVNCPTGVLSGFSPSFKPGQTVYFCKHSATDVVYGREDFFAVLEEDIVAYDDDVVV